MIALSVLQAAQKAVDIRGVPERTSPQASLALRRPLTGLRSRSTRLARHTRRGKREHVSERDLPGPASQRPPGAFTIHPKARPYYT
jgi:hypothetical protein